MRAMFVSITLLLAACAGTGSPAWQKTGASESDLARDRQMCLQQSLTGAPNPTNPASAGYDDDLFRNCMRSRGWRHPS